MIFTFTVILAGKTSFSKCAFAKPSSRALTVPAYDKLMTDSGIEAEKIDEGLGAVKGQLEARAKRAKQ